MPCWEILMFMAIILLYSPDFSVSCITEMEKVQLTNLGVLQSTEDEAAIEDVSIGEDELWDWQIMRICGVMAEVLRFWKNMLFATKSCSKWLASSSRKNWSGRFLTLFCQTWPWQIILHKGWGPEQCERQTKQGTKEKPCHRQLQRKSFVSFYFSWKYENLKSRGNGNWKGKARLRHRNTHYFYNFFRSNLLVQLHSGTSLFEETCCL